MLEVRVLGQFTAQLNGNPVEIASRNAQSLLAYLLLTVGTSHRRERLAGLFWPDTPDTKARTSLRQSLWQIRKAIGAAYLLADDLTVAFDPTCPHWLDATVLERTHNRITPTDDLIATVAVYQGDLLPGFYDEWIDVERERLEALFEHKMHALLDRLLEEQRWPEVLEWGERWIVLGHAPEPAYRALMIAYSSMSDAAGVAATYQRCVDVLQRELAVEPAPETTELFERLAAGERLIAPSVGEAAPLPGISPFRGLHYFEEEDADIFFGREELTARLVGRLREQRFLAIVGASGSGKSSVARAGLIAAIKRGGSPAGGRRPPASSAEWPVHLITPTSHPLAALAFALRQSTEPLSATAHLMDELARDPRTLHRTVCCLLQNREALAEPEGRNRPEQGRRLLLVVDQFEELWTLCRSEEEREAFIANLLNAALAERDAATVVVIALRADFYEHCGRHERLRAALATYQEYIGPMSEA
ncbi:MAG: BTAD domain-containing putative transcriptional regulator, partial [Ardenticatenaceae bacterium]